MQEKIQSIFLDFEIIAFELVPLTNSLKILDTPKREFFELIFFLNDQKIWQKFCQADLTSFSDPLTCWLCISVLTQGFLGSKVTRLFSVNNFRDKYSLRLIFFFKVLWMICRFWKCRKTIRKDFLVLR